MDLMVFEHKSFSVRVINDEFGEPWFVAKDVCDALGLQNPTEAVRSLDDDEKATLRNPEGRIGNGAQVFNVVNKSGLYALIFKSRKPEAKKFRKWVTSEVLPSIRKHDGYSIRKDEFKEALSYVAAGIEQMSRSIEKLSDLHMETIKIVRELSREKRSLLCLRHWAKRRYQKGSKS
ncbi:BRO family protein [Hydrogenimonas thermophila]|uniref:BRO-N domain-containing protein n=1 Tax=Hydrogenimonas thermophila TaxID=223786 RepID=UPI002936E147|nr:BRO family protein [Hydrogenimonas thermophila]WOE69124.1 BRO family protein [Hydrogenimonas thermophila]WOE71634.1 BRO family protein [Hydrogenimonas thermophila]